MGYIHCSASFTSECAICGQSVSPGNLIVLLRRGFGRTPGTSAHKGCWDWPDWRDQQNQNPCLTAGQVDALLNAMVGHRMPDDDVLVQRFLGALRRSKRRQTFIVVHTVPEVRLLMGSDLYAGYQTVLRILCQDRVIGDYWRPVMTSGRPWTPPGHEAQGSLPESTPIRTVPTRRPLATPNLIEGNQQRDSMLELAAEPGYLVKGMNITPVMVGPTAGAMIWIRLRERGSFWRQVHPRQVHLTLEEAQADARRFSGYAASGR